MVLGQHLDIQNETNLKEISQEDLDYIHQLKTGKLIECSVLFGQINNNLSKDQLKNFNNFSSKLGLAFQIVDDVLDVTESTEILGKTNNSDLKNNKHTYVSLVGIEKAKKRAGQLIESAIEDLSMNNMQKTDKLVSIANYLVERRN
jgi:geranylgeranyl pyrophosphate synthase